MARKKQSIERRASAGSLKVMVPQGGTAFHRTVIKQEGDEVIRGDLLTFNPGQPVEVSGDELRSVAEDLGKALYLATDDGKMAPEQTLPDNISELIADHKDLQSVLGKSDRVNVSELKKEPDDAE